MNAPVSAPKEFSRPNEVAFRNYIEAELADTYRKSSHLIIPSSFYLGFQGVTGKQVVLGLNGSDEFTISIDGATAFALASSSSVTAVQSEVTAARSGEASLLARITTVNTTATNAGTAASTVQSEVSAARGGQASLSAKVTLMDSATVSAAGAAATAQSEVTAARQGEASLTAKVTQLSTATSTVDGKLSASYGLTVDGNGRIASMKLLSNGSTSSVKFTASTFTIYDGASDVAMFEVTGGSAYVAGSKVRTESMIANAITTGSDFENDSGVSIGGVGVWTDIASATISTLDASTRVLVNWSAFIGGSDDGTVCDARILRDATVVWGPCNIAGNPPDFQYTFDTEGLITYQPLFQGMVSSFDTDVPGAAGSYTYTLQMTTNNTGGPQWGASFRRLFALAFKR